MFLLRRTWYVASISSRSLEGMWVYLTAGFARSRLDGQGHPSPTLALGIQALGFVPVMMYGVRMRRSLFRKRKGCFVEASLAKNKHEPQLVWQSPRTRYCQHPLSYRSRPSSIPPCMRLIPSGYITPLTRVEQAIRPCEVPAR
jgi:hypothetical protein